MCANRLAVTTLHLTGEKPHGDADGFGPLGLRPALFSAFMDLSLIRYGYPLVLIHGAGEDDLVLPLTEIMDGILIEIAPRGIEGERMRRHLLGLEKEIRILVAGGRAESLTRLWDRAAAALLSGTDGEPRRSLANSLEQARENLRYDGEVVDCREETPARVLKHIWSVAQNNKDRKLRETIDTLALKLSHILQADFMKTEEAKSAVNLKHSFGGAYESVFSFEELSRILRARPSEGPLPEKRRQRLRSALSVLQSWTFFADPGTDGEANRPTDSQAFVHDGIFSALEAYRARQPEMIDLIKAMSIAELEIQNNYRESKHDAFFDEFDEQSLEPEDLALFPGYLVCLQDGSLEAAGKSELLDALSSSLPIKVLLQNHDILDGPAAGSSQASSGIKGPQLAAMAVSLNTAFVLQASSSHLYPCRDSIFKGMAGAGPALFNVFSGSTGDTPASTAGSSHLPPYLLAAAAVESRAFPAFVYDPGAGEGWSSRLSVGVNPQAEVDWPVHHLSYEDEGLQRHTGEVAFTYVDFAACDRRNAGCLAPIPPARWNDEMIPVNEFLDLEEDQAEEKIPYILMIDNNNVLHRLVVEDKLIHAARRCRGMWRNLQELGGINEARAQEMLAREKEVWEREKEKELAQLREQTPSAPDQPPSAGQAAEVEETGPPEPAPAADAPVDEPYIETPRCTSCNECTDINDRMFAYDENVQARIADPDAGTYRQLVEAAENCQVAIIHPGKPRNQDEPGLEELALRAEPFN